MVGGRKEEFSLQPSGSQVSGLTLRNINWLSDFSIWKEILSESGDLRKHSWETSPFLCGLRMKRSIY